MSAFSTTVFSVDVGAEVLVDDVDIDRLERAVDRLGTTGGVVDEAEMESEFDDAT